MGHFRIGLPWADISSDPCCGLLISSLSPSRIPLSDKQTLPAGKFWWILFFKLKCIQRNQRPGLCWAWNTRFADFLFTSSRSLCSLCRVFPHTRKRSDRMGAILYMNIYPHSRTVRRFPAFSTPVWNHLSYNVLHNTSTSGLLRQELLPRVNNLLNILYSFERNFLICKRMFVFHHTEIIFSIYRWIICTDMLYSCWRQWTFLKALVPFDDFRLSPL